MILRTDDKVLSTIHDVVGAMLPAARIVLFGSRARGEATTTSDYDLLIVVERSLDARAKLALRTQVRRRLLDEGILSDVLIESEEEIRLKKDLPGHIVRNILREGVAL
jgi:predicted nucleotidyltransferase